MSTSIIRRALKKRKYSYIKTNIAIMILASNQMKARKLFWEKYLEEDLLKYIHLLMNLFSKEEKLEAENGLQNEKNMLYLW